MTDNGWSRLCADPIQLPDGRELRTLRDAGNCIAKLPKREHDAPRWHLGVQSLMLVVEHARRHHAAQEGREEVSDCQGEFRHL
jgi:hypothetical protein